MTITTSAAAYCPSDHKIKTLYSGLKRHSIAQHLAFYELYPHTNEGCMAADEAFKMLGSDMGLLGTELTTLNRALEAIVSLINKQPNEPPVLDDEDLQLIEMMARKLSNRKLKGHLATAEEDVLKLEAPDIDISRGLFLSQFGDAHDAIYRARCYDAAIDMLALQILAQLPEEACAATKIEAINHFIFNELCYRFPPQSIHSKNIDLYTFLPSVLDSRRGVCLGISLLYLSIAQRLDLPLEVITPPGHIYVRYRDAHEIINIETTARGVRLECQEYLGIDCPTLQQRSVKESIGMAHFNQASIFLQREEFQQALTAYEHAAKYLPNDSLLQEFMGICALMVGHRELGESCLKKVQTSLKHPETNFRTFAQDYFQGHTTIDGIKALFLPVDETRSSIQKKYDALYQAHRGQPLFREVLFALITTCLQLHDNAQAVLLLEKYHAQDAENPKVEYYLAALHAERCNYAKSWVHLKNAERIVKAYPSTPKALKELRRELSKHSPEYTQINSKFGNSAKPAP